MWSPHGQKLLARHSLSTKETSIKDSSAELVVNGTPQASSTIVGPLKQETQGFTSLPGTTIAKIGKWLLLYPWNDGPVFSTSPAKYRCQLTTSRSSLMTHLPEYDVASAVIVLDVVCLMLVDASHK
jgi:hypothetical protein